MTDPKESYTKANRTLWNTLAQHHARSDFYDVEGFKKGNNSLTSIEMKALPDVRDKDLLHLQCHFGMDTLSWARLGARASGLDFSTQAITRAQSLSQELDIPARFYCADVYDAESATGQTFDIIFTSYGVINWLADLERWAKVIKSLLRPGGTFFIVEFHPFLWMWDDAFQKIQNPYFTGTEPIRETVSDSYATRNANLQLTEYTWNHSLGEVINAVLKAGLDLEYVREHPFSPYPVFSGMVEQNPGEWVLKEQGSKIPYLFSIKAHA